MIVALPSRKTVPRTVSFFVLLFHESLPALLHVHEYETLVGVRLIAAVPTGVALLFRPRSAPDAVSRPLGKTEVGSEPVVQGDKRTERLLSDTPHPCCCALSRTARGRRERCKGSSR